MIRAILLVLAALLVAPSAAAQITTKHPGQVTVYNVTDPAYGAIADAVEASGCDAGEDTPMDCSTPGTGTDNNAAFQAAIDAAEASGGEVYIPCGLYRINSQLEVEESNVSFRGEGACSVLLFGATGGQTLFYACKVAGDSCATQIENIHFKDFVIRDDDPFAHGCQHCEIVTVTGITGAFHYAEPVTFTGAETGYFYWQSATTGAGTIIYTEVSANTVAATDTITGDNSGESATIATITHETGEETAGPNFINVKNFSVKDMRFDFVGDEAIVVNGLSTEVTIAHNTFNHVPATPSKGSSINLAGGGNVTIIDNDIILGLAAGHLGINSGISLAGSSTGGGSAPANNLIIHNRIIEPDDDANDHTSAEAGIALAANALGNVDDTSIQDNYIELDIDELGVCDDNTTICDEDGDCPNYCKVTTYNAGCQGTGINCTAINTEESTNDINGLLIQGNNIKGGLDIEISGTGGNLSILGNSIIGSHMSGIYLSAASSSTDFFIQNNSISGHGLQAIAIINAGTGIISENIINSPGSELYAGYAQPAVINLYDATVVDELLIDSNNITGPGTLAGIIAHGIDCNKDYDVVVSRNTISSIDATAVRDCKVVLENKIKSAGGTGVQSDGIAGGSISENMIDSTGIPIYCDDCTKTKVINNTVDGAGVGIQLVQSGAASDFNICMGNINLNAGGPIECGDGVGPGDQEGCAAEGAGAAATYCGGNYSP